MHTRHKADELGNVEEEHSLRVRMSYFGLEVAKRAARPGPARARFRHGPFRHGPLGTADETGRAVPAHVPSRRPKHGPWMAGPCPCRHGTPEAHGPFGARRPVKHSVFFFLKKERKCIRKKN
uniref:Uncharacterized protein n=1 Tax=Oryza sativa subsp. japonica TaxID=39947 RepID=Q654D7_ORYSJ|nr:hypothetical protein [Oryza sativa Japonica Group]BAD45828.1 hypothetical protein [Oryza sativa Japonica Group]